MGVEYYLLDDAAKEVFLLGRGRWHAVFHEQEAAIYTTPLAGTEWHVEFVEALHKWLKGRSVELCSDCDDLGAVAIPVTIMGSRYSSDKNKIGTTMNRWPFVHERDGWQFP